MIYDDDFSFIYKMLSCHSLILCVLLASGGLKETLELQISKESRMDPKKSGEERLKVKWRVGLGILSVYTCGGEYQRLQNVRKGDDALNAGIIIHDYQSVHLSFDDPVHNSL